MVVVSRLWLMGKKKGGWQRALDPQDPGRWTAKRRYLTFSGKWGQIPIDRGPECGPGAIGTGNAAYELKQPAKKSPKQENQQEEQPEQQEHQEQQQHQEQAQAAAPAPAPAPAAAVAAVASDRSGRRSRSRSNKQRATASVAASLTLEWRANGFGKVVVDQVHAAQFPSSPRKGGKADLQIQSCR